MTSLVRRDIIMRQLFEKDSSTYTYLLADPASKEAVLIDPVFETVERDARLIEELGLTLKYVANTHVHADHITGSGYLKHRFATHGTQSVLGARNDDAEADLKLAEGSTLRIGAVALKVFETPGHTEGCVTYVLHDNLVAFTGDALLVRGCGRTDFQGGSARHLFASVTQKIFTLPDACALFPAHDYKGFTHTTVGEEKAYNPRFAKGLDGFIDLMDNLGLSLPKKMDIALPPNKCCGLQNLPGEMDAQLKALQEAAKSDSPAE